VFVDYGNFDTKDSGIDVQLGVVDLELFFGQEVTLKFVGVVGHKLSNRTQETFDSDTWGIRNYVFIVYQIDRTQHQVVLGPIISSRNQKLVLDLQSNVYPPLEMTNYNINSKKSLITGHSDSLPILSKNFTELFSGVLRQRVDVVLPFLNLVKRMIGDGTYKPLGDNTIEGFGGKKLNGGIRKGDLLLTLIRRHGRFHEIGIVHAVTDQTFNALGLETGERFFNESYSGDYGWGENVKTPFPIAPVFFKLRGFEGLDIIGPRFDLSIFKWVNHFMVFPISQILKTRGPWISGNVSIDTKEGSKDATGLPEIHSVKCNLQSEDYCLPYLNEERIHAFVVSALENEIVIYSESKWIPNVHDSESKRRGVVKEKEREKEEEGEESEEEIKKEEEEEPSPQPVIQSRIDRIYYHKNSTSLRALDILMGDQPLWCGPKYTRTLQDTARNQEIIIDSYLNAFHMNCVCIRLQKVLNERGDERLNTLKQLLSESHTLKTEVSLSIQKSSSSKLEYTNVVGMKNDDIEHHMKQALQELKV